MIKYSEMSADWHQGHDDYLDCLFAGDEEPVFDPDGMPEGADSVEYRKGWDAARGV